MPGSFDINNYPPSLYSEAPQAQVALYDPEGEGVSGLPNVRCVRIDIREGPDPPTATFRYVMDDAMANGFGWPNQFEELWPLNTQGNYVVQCDDELIVGIPNPDGSLWIPFDGFASIPQVDYSQGQQLVNFTAQNVAIRYYDEPLTMRTQRNADMVDVTDGTQDVTIRAPIRFNPANNSVGKTGGYVGNCVPSAYYTELGAEGDDQDDDEENTDEDDDAEGEGSDEDGENDDEDDGLGPFPVFLDPLCVERGDDDVSYWYVSDALEYLMATWSGLEYATWPTFDTLEELLSAQYPSQGSQTQGKSGNQTADISIRDYDATNKCMPVVFADLLSYAGFLMYWDTQADSDGEPETILQLYRRDAGSTTAPKPIYLSTAGTTYLDLSANNVSSVHLSRDMNQVKNAWEIETQPKLFEITVVLAPGFQPDPADMTVTTSTTSGRNAFKSANLTQATATTRRKYRWWIGDECADGHWDVVNQEWEADVSLDLSSIFPPKDNTEDAAPSYVKRYRPGSDTLIATDPQGRPLKAVLEYQAGTAESDPYILGPDGPDDSTWLTIPNGWRLLPDRLGIELTVDDPSAWATGNPKVPKINTITALNTPDAGNQQFSLRLTTVIEADSQLGVVAPRRIASPTQYSRVRIADGKDHFQYNVISVNSLNYTGDGTNPQVKRDDTDLARSHVYALRSAHEFPTLAGSVTIPWLTDYYKIGDRVSIIQGRDAVLTTNVALDQGEAASYPWVVGIGLVFEPKQQTVLQLSDARAEPQPYRG